MAMTSDRALGMSEGPIPFASIDRFAQRYGIDDVEDFDEFRSLISAIDREYLRIRAEQAERQNGAGQQGKPI